MEILNSARSFGNRPPARFTEELERSFRQFEAAVEPAFREEKWKLAAVTPESTATRTREPGTVGQLHTSRTSRSGQVSGSFVNMSCIFRQHVLRRSKFASRAKSSLIGNAASSARHTPYTGLWSQFIESTKLNRHTRASLKFSSPGRMARLKNSAGKIWSAVIASGCVGGRGSGEMAKNRKNIVLRYCNSTRTAWSWHSPMGDTPAQLWETLAFAGKISC